jgi:serine/threonine protein kinase
MKLKLLDRVLIFNICFLFLTFKLFFFSVLTSKTLGKGGEGTVYLTKHVDNNIEYALKEIFIKNAEESYKVKQTLEVIRKLPSSPYIIKYYSALESANYVYIPMEYCRGGSLQDLIQKRPADRQFEEEVLFTFFFFIVLF